MIIIMANTNTKYELIKNTVVVWKTIIENKIITKINEALMAKVDTKWELVYKRNKWCRWNLSGEKGLLPIESRYK